MEEMILKAYEKVADRIERMKKSKQIQWLKSDVYINKNLTLRVEVERGFKGNVYSIGVYPIVNGKTVDVCPDHESLEKDIKYLLRCYAFEEAECVICGKRFVKKKINHMCCSDECRKISERNTTKRYANEHKSEIAERRKAKKKKEKNMTNAEKIIEIDRKAKERGLSYGQYVARYGG